MEQWAIPDPVNKAGTIRLCIAVLLLLFSLVAVGVQANRESVEDGTNDFNYVYGAVLGTGYYKSQTERLLILRMPLSQQIPWSRGEMRLLAPIAVGLRDTREQEAETSAPDSFSSLSIMPGLAMTYTLRDNWQISPLAQVGFARDFKNNTSSWVGTAAVRHDAWWDFEPGRFTLAQRLRLAGQRNRNGGGKTGFLLVEQGAQWKFPTNWQYAGNDISGSVFLLWQHYLNDLNIDGVGQAQVNIKEMFELGVTVGFNHPVNFGWIRLERVGISIARGNSVDGNEITAINFNLGFPLTED